MRNWKIWCFIWDDFIQKFLFMIFQRKGMSIVHFGVNIKLSIQYSSGGVLKI